MRKLAFAVSPKNADDITALEKVPLSERLTCSTTYEIIHAAAKTWPQKPAIHFLPHGSSADDPVTINYQDLLTRVNQAANLFLSLQKTHGNVVSYLLPNLPQTHFTLWGAQAVGIVQPLRPDLSPEHIATLLQKANSKILVSVGEFIPGPLWHNVLAARKLYPALEKIYVIGGSPNEACGIYDFETELNKQPISFTQPDISQDSVCAYFHTSATTSLHVKLVRLTQRQQLFSTWAIGTCLGYQENDVIAVGLPFFHVGAPMVGGLVPFACGATTVMMGPMGWMGPGVVEDFWNIVMRYQVTVTAALNFMYSQLLSKIKKNSTLRLAISGTPLSAAESAEYKAAGVLVSDIYGSSETVMAAFNVPDQPKPSSMGLRLPYEKMKVMKPDGSAECMAGEVGELWISGPNVTLGYQGDSQAAFTGEGWFKTGDLVQQNADGYFWFFDRTADVIYRNGKMIASLALELQFEKHPQVARAAVIGQPDSQDGQVPVLYVLPKPGCELLISELQKWSHENVDAFNAPVEIHIVCAFPLNGIAKVVKPILREEARALATATFSGLSV